MTDRYELAIPHRDPGEHLDVETVLDLDSAARRAGVDREQRAIFRELAFAALLGEDAPATIGELVDRVGTATPAERRALVNDARDRAGLERLDTLEDREHFKAMQDALPRGFEGSASCAAERCTRLPTAPDGRLIRVQARKWWCSEHADQAGPDDHLPPPPPRIDPRTMRLRPSLEEEARITAEDERRRTELRRRDAARRAEADQLDRIRARYRASGDVPSVLGTPQGSDDR